MQHNNLLHQRAAATGGQRIDHELDVEEGLAVQRQRWQAFARRQRVAQPRQLTVLASSQPRAHVCNRGAQQAPARVAGSARGSAARRSLGGAPGSLRRAVCVQQGAHAAVQQRPHGVRFFQHRAQRAGADVARLRRLCLDNLRLRRLSAQAAARRVCARTNTKNTPGSASRKVCRCCAVVMLCSGAAAPAKMRVMPTSASTRPTAAWAGPVGVSACRSGRSGRREPRLLLLGRDAGGEEREHLLQLLALSRAAPCVEDKHLRMVRQSPPAASAGVGSWNSPAALRFGCAAAALNAEVA